MALPGRLPPPRQRARLPVPPLRPPRPPRTGLLRRHPAFAAFFTARAVSLVGDGVGNLALVVHVQRVRGTGTAVGLLLLVASLPRLLSPLAGTIADRYDRRAVLIGGELAQGAAVGVVLVWLPPLPVLLLLLLAKETVVAVSEPAAQSAVPALVPEDALGPANALLGGLREAGEVLGPLAGGVIVAAAGVRAGLAVDALTFVVSVPLLLRMPPLVPEPAARRRRLTTDAWAGLRYTLRQPVTRALTIAFLLVGLAAADDVALPFLARELDAGERGIGALYAAVGAGLIAAYVVLARTRRPAAATATALTAGAAVAGLGNLATGLAPALAAAVAFQVVRGLGIAVFDTNLQTAIQRTVPADLLGRVFANVYGAVNLSACVGLLAGGVLLDATSARTVLVMCGVTGLVAAAVVARRPAG